MSSPFEMTKNRFRFVLTPMFELLLHKKENLPNKEWIEFMSMTESSIINNPNQFLGNDLPAKSLIDQAVKEIFAEFRLEESVEVNG